MAVGGGEISDTLLAGAFCLGSLTCCGWLIQQESFLVRFFLERGQCGREVPERL